MYILYVFLETTQSDESFTAHNTCVRFLRGMSTGMFPQIYRLCESLPTYYTCVRLLTCVSVGVCLKG